MPLFMKTCPLPKRFLYAELMLLSLISALMILAWIPAVLSLITYGSLLASALRAAVFLNLTAVTLILLVLFVKRELRRFIFFMTDEHLGVGTPSRNRKIRLAAVESVSLLRFPLGGGVVIIESGDGSLTIPLIFENCYDLFTGLREVLNRNKPDISTATDWETIRRACSLSEMAAHRAEKVFTTILTACIAMLPVGFLVGAVYWNMSVVPLMLWSIIGPLFPIAAYGSADLILRTAFVRSDDAGGVMRKPDENRILTRTALVFFLLYLVCAVLYKAVFL